MHDFTAVVARCVDCKALQLVSKIQGDEKVVLNSSEYLNLESVIDFKMAVMFK